MMDWYQFLCLYLWALGTLMLLGCEIQAYKKSMSFLLVLKVVLWPIVGTVLIVLVVLTPRREKK